MTAYLLQPRRIGDARGWFSEVWNQERMAALGLDPVFCQDNHSYTARKGTLRGLHFQRTPHAQAKLVRCTRGRIFDVAIDLRRASPTFGHWVGVDLSAEDGRQLFVPRGFAHGFLTLEEDCEVQYKVDAYYDPAADSGVKWDDPAIGIAWPELAARPVLSDKDERLPHLADLDLDFPYDGTPLAPLKTFSL